MNKSELISLLEYPSEISEKELLSLQKLKGEFPFCHSLHLLFQKGLKNTNSLEFEKHLSTTSLNSPNREVLYNLIFKSKLREKITQIEFEISTEVSKELNLNESIKEQSEQEIIETQKVVDEVEALILEEIVQKDYFEEVKIAEAEEPKKTVETISDVEEIPSKRSFTNWLNPKGKPKENISKKPSSIDIIEKFIQENPSISKAKKDNYTASEIAQLSLNDNDDVVTETLARVYMKQGHYDKAIKTYQKLSLKIPEKKAFFASQIEVIEELKKQK